MKTINSNKIEILRENYKQQANTHEISFREYIELEAQSDSNFFRFLFDEDFEQDFDTSLTDEQKEKYERFLNKIQDYNIFYIEIEDEENTLVSSHTARRTFATNAYISSIPTARIMLLTGHKTEAAFFKYIRIQKQENAMLLSEHPFFRD